ncbi:MAG: PQQ-binding-like beta-propeller repeat protein [Acidobacteriota bacterium]
MKIQAFLPVSLVLSASLLMAQGPGPAVREAKVTDVPFSRILNANQEPQNWLTYSGGLMSQRHSQLKQITPANAKDLELKWVYQTRSLEKHEATPLVVDGVMYAIQSPNDIIALDAVTGKTIWTYSHKPAEGTRNPCCGNLTRGLAILGDKLFLATLDARLKAINAKTGKLIWDVVVGDYKQQYSMTQAPLAVKDKVIVGVAGGEHGIRGYIAAYDANTAKRSGNSTRSLDRARKNAETWSGDSYLHGGAPIWITGSYDPQTNLTYWGTGNPAPDWDGAARLGDNLYSCSVIALDVDTGKLSWHYQFNPHNEFDWDATQVPVLADIDFAGRPTKVMLWANRNGVFYVLDRVTGKFLLGKSFTKTNWYSGFDENGRPKIIPEIVPTTKGTLVYPGNQGGTNWYNPSFSPVTGLFYIPAWENTSTTYIKGEEPPEFHDGQSFTGAFPKGGSTAEDQFSSIIAIDPKTGERKWTHRLTAPQTEAGRHDYGHQCPVQRRTRRRVLRFGCPRRKDAVGDESRSVGFRGTDDVHGEQ